MPNGVICAGAVEGSNQLGAIVTCQAMTASPAGAGWPPTPWATPRVTTAPKTSGTIRRCAIHDVRSSPMFSSRRLRGLPRDLEAGLVASDPEATTWTWLSPPRSPFTRSTRAAGAFIAAHEYHPDDARATVDGESRGFGRRRRLSPWWGS